MSGLNPITEKVENHWFMLCRSCRHAVITQHTNTNCLRPAAFEDSRKKTRLNTRGFAWEYLRSCLGYEPGRSIKRHGKSSSLHLKKIFCLWVRFFCQWRHKWTTFRPLWPTVPGPGRQPLGGSISLKFLLETRLQSESLDTLDDLLGFQVQKLWSKLVKIFD